MLSSEETARLLAHIDRDAVVRLMVDLQHTRSFSGQEAEAMRTLARWLQERGVTVELVDVADEPGRPDLVARVPGSGGGTSLMLNGHLDIDPVPLNYPGDPWDCREEHGVLYGHGLVNMKAGVAALAAATVAIARAGVPLRGDLLATGVVGELQGGVGAYDLAQRGVLADYTIVCEPSGMDVRTIHSGAVQMLVHVTGSSAWIGALHRAPHVNAVEAMTEVVRALRSVRFHVPPRADPSTGSGQALVGLPRLIVSSIDGGVGHERAKWRGSYVPDYCSILLEVRGLPGQDWEETRRDVERALEPLRAQDPSLRLEVEMPPATYAEPWRSMKVPAYGIDVPPDHDLPQTVRRHHVQVLGKEPERVGFQDPGSYAWTDAGHFARAGSTCVIYGPVGNQDRGVLIDNVLNCARVLALTTADICMRGR